MTYSFAIAALAAAMWWYGDANGMTTVWLPASLSISALIAAPTKRWAASDKVGEAAGVSVLLKLIFNLNALYTTIASFLCLGVLVSWMWR